jgi:UDP-glucose 4-epimerase
VNLLVTGANGFLGRHVVEALSRAGHRVRALIRPAAVSDHLERLEKVEIARADLRTHPDLAPYFEDIDVVVHLAAARGSDFACFAATITGTERLFDAMARTPVKRLVLCSSFSVYDWRRAHGTVDESLPLYERAYESGGYAAAKSWQERLASRRGEENGWEVTILRPGYIWGRENPCPESSTGERFGPFHLVFGLKRQLPFTHAVNCADVFRLAVENPAARGEVFNVVDNHGVTAWRFMGEVIRRGGIGGVRVPIPYPLLFAFVMSVVGIGRVVLGRRMRLPSTFVPARFAEGYRPLRYDTGKLDRVLGWRPPLDFEECLRETFPASGT